MDNQDITALQQLINDFNSLKIKERSGLTFLEIAKCPHLENVWSNILAFYLNPNNEHNFFDFILNSVFETAGEKTTINNFKNIRVRTEYPTEKGNRIDIVVFADTFVLGIENKVDAALYNDLEDYSNTIESLAKPQNLQAYKIVLSKYRNNVSDGFVNITYSDLIKNIKNKIGNYTAYSDTKYLIFLFDFLKNIENNINSQSMADNLEVINFFHNNIEKVNKLLEYHNKLNKDLEQKLNGIHAAIKQEEINIILKGLRKQTQFGGPGRFTWSGYPLIKYNIVINDISLLFQVGITDYKLVSHFWFSEEKYAYLETKLVEKGVRRRTYEYDETSENIALLITQQIKTIISILDDETK
jgi:hypothetical protein